MGLRDGPEGLERFTSGRPTVDLAPGIGGEEPVTIRAELHRFHPSLVCIKCVTLVIVEIPAVQSSVEASRKQLLSVVAEAATNELVIMRQYAVLLDVRWVE